MRKQTSRELQALKTKRKIYNAAIELFNKFGFENTSIEDIAQKNRDVSWSLLPLLYFKS